MNTSIHFRLSTLLLVLGLLCSGCARGDYRTRADRDAEELVTRATTQTQDPIAQFSIYPKPDSRMFDPFSPDFPPMPPDDPSAHRLMQCVDCKKGSRCWQHRDRTDTIQNVAFEEYLPRDEDGVVLLDSRAAVEVALVNSNEFQDELETLYLSALDVSFERFRFDAQFFGGHETFFTADGPDRSSGRSNNLDLSTRTTRMTKLFATGGELVVGLANSLVWEFAGPDTHTATTLLDFSLVQPLLRGGGRATVLEELTLAERGLLADVRQMERFRRGFYSQVVTGASAGAGPARGGFVGTGGLSSLRNSVRTGIATAGGFTGLLQTQQQIRNQQFNVVALRDSLARLEAIYQANRIDRFQVDLARQALYNGQSRLWTLQNSYETSLDAYKVQLGLPPDLKLRLTDPRFKQFRLTRDSLMQFQNEVADLLDRIRGSDPQPSDNEWRRYLVSTEKVHRQILEHLKVVTKDFELLKQALPARRENLRALVARPELQERNIDLAAYSPEELDRRVESMIGELEKLFVRFKQFDRAIKTIRRPEQRTELVNLLNGASEDLLELGLLQARARLDSLVLVPVRLDPKDALNIARVNRRDWMNARAALVDAWRAIEPAANDLESDLDIVFEGDISNTGDNPLRLRSTTGRLRAGLAWDAPLTRLVERNAYRETLIQYQQTRRDYYVYEDRVNQGLRTTLRNMRLNQLDFELQRTAVQIAISQVNLTRLRLTEPPKPGATGNFGATTAQNLVSSLTSLLNAQNDILRIWVSYEVQRLLLDLDLGTMQLDEQGIWIDPGPIEPSSGQNDPVSDQKPEEVPAPESLPKLFPPEEEASQ